MFTAAQKLSMENSATGLISRLKRATIRKTERLRSHEECTHPSLADRLPVREHISLTTLAGGPNCQGVITVEQSPQLLSQAAQARHSSEGRASPPIRRRSVCSRMGEGGDGTFCKGQDPLLLLDVPQKVL